jgi:hypothetical protein
MRNLLRLAALALLVPALARSQDHVHTPGMVHGAADSVAVASPGQDAFGAIAEIVRILEADPATDWSAVNLEALRQHLIDMHEVTLRSIVRQEVVPGGARFTVEGEGRTRDAIRRLTRAHAATMTAPGEPRVTVEATAAGIRMTVLAADPGDAKAVEKIRGLGFIGFMTVGTHHGPHHLAMARGKGH